MILSFKPQFKQPILDGTKIHTIREDPHDRWKPGMKIHAATGVRTKNYDCFFESECVSVQTIVIQVEDWLGFVWIDGRQLSPKETTLLALNDGFDNTLSFYEWFIDDPQEAHVEGNIIHWTAYRY